MLTYLPPIKKNYEYAPVYFLIPGGGWHQETRQSMIEFSAQSVEALRKQGFAVVSIDYRVCREGVVMREIVTDCFDAARNVFKGDYDIGDRFAVKAVAAMSPPTLLCAGTSDYLVFPNNSEILYKKLKECNAKAELVLSLGGGHCFEKIHNDIEPNITMAEMQDIIAKFILNIAEA